MARRAVADPAVFGWAWPCSSSSAGVDLAGGPITSVLSNRRIWALGHLIMAFGVVLLVWPGIGGIIAASLCVGALHGRHAVGLQEAHRLADGNSHA
jgi:hypothetical protein